MCHSEEEATSRRHFHYAGGTLVQCLGCGSIGVEFGTSYLIFSETEFFGFARWFGSVNWREEPMERGRVHIRVREESSSMISLTRTEVRSVSSLLTEGMRWVANSGLIRSGASQGKAAEDVVSSSYRPPGGEATIH